MTAADERILQIRRAHASARPTDENPAWKNTHTDLDFVLWYLDKVLADRNATGEKS